MGEASRDQAPHPLSRRALLLLLGLALAARVVSFPSRYELRSIDEMTYVADGLLLWEGIAPYSKQSPAGPLVWVGWLAAAARTAEHVVFPGTHERSVAGLARPFAAVEHALFDLYRDLSGLRGLMSLLMMALSLAAVAAAFRLGERRAGLAGGVVGGGLAALAPTLLQYSTMATPYCAAWSFAILAQHQAALGRRGSSLLMGLALASRIEMLLFAPLVAWERRERGEPLGRWAAEVVGCTLLVSPWLLLHLLGNLRGVVTVRLLGPPFALSSVAEMVWQEGLGAAVLLTVIGLAVGRRWLAAAYIGALLVSAAKSSGFGLRHQGPVLVAIVTTTPLALAALAPRLRPWLAALVLALPAVQAVRWLASSRTAPDQATAWVEAHVPANTLVYLFPSLHDPLPTTPSADELWSEVTSDQAWRRKFVEGAGHFQLGGADPPRALSEENLIQERGKRRRWFMLGGVASESAPRYRLRLVADSPLFGLPFPLEDETLVAELRRTGGVLIRRGQPLADAGTLVASWPSAWVYCTPDVCSTLKL